jgi:hypothetical protein
VGTVMSVAMPACLLPSIAGCGAGVLSVVI